MVTPDWLCAELQNWAAWLNYDAAIGPQPSRCMSIEARYVGEIGDVLEGSHVQITPDVPSAERMQAMIARLPILEQYALAIHYAGAPAVMRWRRVSEFVHRKSLQNAEAKILRLRLDNR